MQFVSLLEKKTFDPKVATWLLPVMLSKEYLFMFSFEFWNRVPKTEISVHDRCLLENLLGSCPQLPLLNITLAATPSDYQPLIRYQQFGPAPQYNSCSWLWSVCGCCSATAWFDERHEQPIIGNKPDRGKGQPELFIVRTSHSAAAQAWPRDDAG